MKHEMFIMKNVSQESSRQNEEIKARLLERIYQLNNNDGNGNTEPERWQKEESEILIAKWRSIL